MRRYEEIEGAEQSPYMRLRVGKILEVYYDDPAKKSLGTANIQWLDWTGTRDLVRLSFPSFSNVVVSTGTPSSGDSTKAGAQTARCYGDISIPSPGDIALIGFRSPTAAVILGYLPQNYGLQTSDDESKPSFWGTMRRIMPGEFTRLSKQQAEIWLDKAGAVQIIAKAQPVEGNEEVDGSATEQLSDIDPKQVPSTEIVRLIIGEAYEDETFAKRLQSISEKKVIFGALMRDGEIFQVFDADGNFELMANSVNLYQQQEDGTIALISMNSAGQISIWDAAGNQIIMDAPNQKIKIVSEAGDNIILGSNNIQVATQGGENVTLDNASGTVTVTAQTVNINSGQIGLGGFNAAMTALMDSVVTTTKLAAIFNTHVHLAAGSGIPAVPMTTIPGLPTCPGALTTEAA